MYCPQQQISHVIQQGENLYQLARYYQTTVPVILALNPNIDPYGLQIGSTVTICPGENFTGLVNNQNAAFNPDVTRQIDLINRMRLAWEQNVYWTRMLMISILARLPDQNDVTNRLMRIPNDIAGIFADYYGTDAANTIAQLLMEHLQIGAHLATALRENNSTEATNFNRQWYINADRMADAFSSLNPYFDREEVRLMLYNYLALVTRQIFMRLAGNYPVDIAAFDLGEQLILQLADYFSAGIMQQFPERFRSALPE